MKPSDYDSTTSQANVSKLIDVYGPRVVVPFEQLVYRLADALCPSYTGGQWAFVSPEHLIMVPITDDSVWHVQVPTNFYDGKNTDPDAFGHAVSLIAFNVILSEIGERATTHVNVEPLIQKFDGLKTFSLDTLTGQAQNDYIRMID